MRIGMLIAGFVLLFNPVVQVVDIIPDCIGFLLIVGALTKPAYLVGRIAEARSLYLKLALVETVKIFAIFIQARVPDSDNTFPLLLATVFGVIELIAFIPAIVSLFDGLVDCTVGYDGGMELFEKTVERKKKTKEKPSRKKKLKVKSFVTKTRNFVLFFYIFRVCATVAPELTELEMYDYIGEVSATSRSWASFKPHLQVLMALVVLILGVIYTVKVSRFFGRIKKEQGLLRFLDGRYANEILPRTTLFIAKRMKRALIFFGLSAIASLVLTFESVNILIGIVSSALLITAAATMARYDKYSWISVILASVRGGLSIFNFINQVRYFDEHEVEAVFWVEEAAEWYYNMAVVEVVEYVFALLAALSFILIMMRLLKQHIGLCGVNVETAQFSKKSRDAETYKAVKTKLLICAVLTSVNFIMAAAYRYILPYNEAIGAINNVITIIYIAYTIYALNFVDDNVYDNELSIA